MKAHLLVLISLFASVAVLVAQEHSDYQPLTKMENGEKHIYVDQLGLSPNMTIMELLEFFPETMTRGETDVLSNYAVVIDGQNMGYAKDVVLLQMTISEVKEIIIENDPSVSYTSNGTGGTITLKAKDVTDGISGNAQIDASTEANVLVSGNVNYKKDKLKIVSSARADIYDTHTNQTTCNYIDDAISSIYDTETEQKDFIESAKIGITLTPNTSDELEFTGWETYGNFKYDEQSIVDAYTIAGNDATNRKGVQEAYNRGKNLYALAKFAYTHTFAEDHKLKFNINYTYTRTLKANYEMPIGNNLVDSVCNSSTQKSVPHSTFAELSYEVDLYKTELHTFHLKVGSTASFQAASNQNFNYQTTADTTFLSDSALTHTNAWQCSPYAELKYNYSNKVFLYAGGRYNMFYNNDLLGQSKHILHDYMVKLEADYLPTPNHALRLSTLRNGLAPTTAQLTGSLMTANFEYVYDGYFSAHHFNTSVAFQYDHTHLVDNSSFNIYSARCSALWQIKWFTASLTAQYFHREDNNVQQRLNYYTIRLTPIFHLPKQWTILGTIMYNSAEHTTNKTLGDYLLTSLRVSKQIKQWSLHLELNDPIHYTTTDITYNTVVPALRTETHYNLYNRYLNLGVMYRF